MSFPDDFLFGAATSSFQIEGAADRRGASIWDTFCREPGRVANGDTGDVACDHVARFREDVALMQELGVAAYRFSICWPRVLPAGRGAASLEGLDFYDQLVDALLEAGIEPWVTLYHWDLPQALQDEGGWTVRSTAEAFAGYAAVVANRLGDRVGHWITHNEPWCVAMLGHELGEHAPGWKDPSAALAAAHFVLWSHGLATSVLRQMCPLAKIGITLNFTPAWAASDDPADVEAARRFDGWFNRWFLDPVCGRGYPADMRETFVREGILDERPAWLRPWDEAVMGTPTDFLGVNYYTRAVLRSGAAAAPQTLFAGDERTEMGWEVHPESLRHLLVRLGEAYDGPLYITENGAAYPEATHDPERVGYLQRHLQACLDARAKGVDLRGYFAWSLMDNFEWACGYEKRFGLVHVDYETQARTPKTSARWMFPRPEPWR